MCGINGYNFGNRELVERMNAVTAHRGPDKSKTFFGDGISLGHNRLSIIDLSESADQPMQSADGVLTIAFNGEIYNFKELRAELEGSYKFKTQGDTEVILAAYKTWGSACVERFNGIFAFAIWDAHKKELFLARDHAGIKPLYYFHDNGKFIFSSEIKAILECADVPRLLDRDAFNHYMRVLYVPEPLTMFKNVRKFPQSAHAVFKDDKLFISAYGSRQQTDKKLSFEDAKREAKETISAAVKRQLISDRPVGVYLSGGIDSSVVLHHVMEHESRADTFSVGFDLRDDEDRDKFNKDASLAKRTAEAYGATHHEVLVSSAEVIRYFEKAVAHLDEPISNPTVIPQIVLGEFAKKHVDVVLGGDGGDELFGGYERYRMSLAADMWQRIPYFARVLFEKSNSRFRKLGTPPGVERFALFMFQKDPVVSRVLAPEYFSGTVTRDFFDEKYFKHVPYRPFTETFMDVDRHTWLVDESLMRSDKMSMAWGLEQRVPLLDKEVITLSERVPFAHKADAFHSKKILREAYRSSLPEFLFTEPKRGWFSPGAKWMRHEDVFNAFTQYLSPEYHEGTKALFNWGEVSSMLARHKDKKEYNLTMLWALATFQVWAKVYNVKL